jgi:ligand-binding sensor domain-containing protein
MKSKNGNLWFGGSAGLYMYDGRFITHFTEKEGLAQDNVNTILEDKNGALWIGNYGGITKYSDKAFSHWGGGNVHSIKEDRSGNLWFGIYGGGLIKNDGKLLTKVTRNEGLNSDWVWTIVQDKNDNFWFGTSDKGVSRYKPFGEAAGFIHFIEKEDVSRKNVQAILEDRRGNLWFGTGGWGSYQLQSLLILSKLPGRHSEKFKLYPLYHRRRPG